MMEALAQRVAAVSFDAAGTLIHTAEPVADVYVRNAHRHGVVVDVATVQARFGPAFATAPGRMVGDGRAWWAHVVAHTVGSDNPTLFDALYDHYADPGAWTVTPGAAEVLAALRASGRPVGLVSNFDTRLRGLLEQLGLRDGLDEVFISGEHGMEKPDPRAFVWMADRLGVPVTRLLHVGDRMDADVQGAHGAGAMGWHWTGERANMAVLRTALGVG